MKKGERIVQTGAPDIQERRVNAEELASFTRRKHGGGRQEREETNSARPSFNLRGSFEKIPRAGSWARAGKKSSTSSWVKSIDEAALLEKQRRSEAKEGGWIDLRKGKMGFCQGK